mgnify:CR=1 FL=1|tara:strand:+ start:597 stop:1418 length:822 start_codon:yes stop_codon:yes gene_type:complete
MEPISAIASAIPGIAKGIGSLFGGRARRRRERKAKAEYQTALKGYENFQFDNAYADLDNTFEGMENPFEDLQVATQAADFQAQQQQQGLAQTLDALRGAGGGTGAAAIAQALAQSQARGNQQIAAGLEQQERENQLRAGQAGLDIGMAQAQAGMNLQMAEAGGAMSVQDMEFSRKGTMLGMAQQELAGARQARAQAKAALGEGIGALAGGILGTDKLRKGVGGFLGKAADSLGMATNIGLGQRSKFNRFMQGRNVTDKTRLQGIGRLLLRPGG